MSVEDPKTIDIVSVGSAPNTALLIVSDHLEWTESLEHELALQEKLNAYLRFVESGELYDRFPKATGNRIEFRVVFLHEPDEKGKAFLGRVEMAIQNAGFHFSFQVGLKPIAADKMD